MAFAAVVGDPESERIVGTSSYFLDPQTGLADVAYMVDSEWQGVGLGALLQTRTIEYARAHGVRGFTADVLPTNMGMLAVFRRSGCDVTTRLVDGTYEVQMLFPPVTAKNVNPPATLDKRRRFIRRMPASRSR
jgi:RimJ/RimL family protein N-acetyltransferase